MSKIKTFHRGALPNKLNIFDKKKTDIIGEICKKKVKKQRKSWQYLYFPVSYLGDPQPLPVSVVEGGEASTSHAALEECSLEI